MSQVSRLKQLSGYLTSNPAWVDMFKTIDDIWAAPSGIDPSIHALGLIRCLLQPPSNMPLVPGNTLPDLGQWDRLDTRLLAQQIVDSGFTLSTSSTFGVASQWVLALFLGKYYQSKGTVSLQNFFSYLLGVPVQITPLWSSDFVNFYTYSELPGGWSAVWDGGTYYPTVKVRLQYSPTPVFPSTLAIATMFDYIANINLCLEEIRVNLLMTPQVNMVISAREYILI